MNISSLTAHIDELRVLLADRPIDVLAINETKLDGNVSDNEVQYLYRFLVNKLLVAIAPCNGRSGGGVCFHVRSENSYSVRTDLNNHLLESLSIKIKKPRSKPFVVTTWYRPPDSLVGIFRPFEEIIGKLDSVEFYVLGDLNCNMAAPKLDNSAIVLSSLADVYGLHQLVSEHTRITDKSSSLIVVRFTNTPDRVVCSGVSHIGISDFFVGVISV